MFVGSEKAEQNKIKKEKKEKKEPNTEEERPQDNVTVCC